MTGIDTVEPTAKPAPDYSLSALARYFLALGSFGFGGPIALAGYMQRDLVDRKGWITKQEYLDGLALSQLAPGPLAAQLATYLGWVRGGVFGATLISAAFILPSFLMVSWRASWASPSRVCADHCAGRVRRSQNW